MDRQSAASAQRTKIIHHGILSGTSVLPVTKTNGFRTFLKVDGTFYEPFVDDDMPHKNVHRYERAGNRGDKRSTWHQSKCPVLHNAKRASRRLVRTVTITNLAGAKKDVEVLDGMPALLPYGIALKDMKETAQTTKAWMQVEDVNEKLPYYRVRIALADAAEFPR